MKIIKAKLWFKGRHPNGIHKRLREIPEKLGMEDRIFSINYSLIYSPDSPVRRAIGCEVIFSLSHEHSSDFDMILKKFGNEIKNIVENWKNVREHSLYRMDKIKN